MDGRNEAHDSIERIIISRDRAFYVIASYPESDVLTCSWYAEDDRG